MISLLQRFLGGSGRSTPPASVASFGGEATYKRGRRFLKDSPYLLPKDLGERERLNLQHYVLFYAQGYKHYMAPVPRNVRDILDVGTGTGIWGSEMAARFPNACVTGLDIEPPCSPSATRRLNFRFVQGDLLHGLPFEEASFDYVHQRLLSLAIPDDKFMPALRELVRVCRIGGWVELLEMSNELLQAGPNISSLYSLIEAFFHIRKISLDKFKHLGEYLDQLVMGNVRSFHVDVPVGAWSRHGEMMLQDVIAGAQALKPRLCEELMVDEKSFNALLEEIPEECKVNKTSYRCYGAIAQKGAFSGLLLSL